MAHRDKNHQPAAYTFGDSDIAARRLSTVADVFAPSSAAFLHRSAPRPVRLAVDLGCGPGHSTRLIASTVTAEQVIGLDRSPAFLSLAAADAPARIGFEQHDVTEPRLPLALSPDLIYARLLLSHLTDPVDVVRHWCAQLAPRGRLLLDEVDRVTTEHPVALDYQRVVDSMLRHNGQRLEIGSTLARMPDPEGTVRRDDTLVTVRPSSRSVGRMFGLNLRVWREDPYVAATFGTPWLMELQEHLDAAAAGEMDLPVTWTMRQLVLETCLLGMLR
ncbi:class I SAM-dependent methyltransferase [Streptomyces sp. NPDC004609]|uniref:class I SAM-dependent methyltransferase n=1 Tax=Streptomyces sp. NPDC004609 TaxID=3364704 RepID=UPI0036D1AFA5